MIERGDALLLEHGSRLRELVDERCSAPSFAGAGSDGAAGRSQLNRSQLNH